MNVKRAFLSVLALLLFGLQATNAAAALTPKQQLGKLLYFDKKLSINQNQSCSSCHLPGAGFADPDQNLPVSEGSIPGLFGTRNAPTASYAVFSPFFYYDSVAGMYLGGQFWDGRANSLAEQAQGPFLNPVEMAMPDKHSVLMAIASRRNPNKGIYANLFMQVYGIEMIDFQSTNPVLVDAIYAKVTDAIGDFEKSSEVSPFSSRFDQWLATGTGLTADELAGMVLFNTDFAQGGAGCFLCHPSAPTIAPDGTVMPPLFTDFTYDNLGIPKSNEFPIADNPIDYGLGARPDIVAFDPTPIVLADGTKISHFEAGKFKVSSLRNIGATAPYGHNGYFKTLKDIVHFYNARDVDPAIAPPEVPLNMNTGELGNLGLTPAQEDQIVAFLLTLTDGAVAPQFSFPFPPSP